MQKTASMVETSVMINRTGSVSLKSTIPEMYVNLLNLKPGDKLIWEHDIVNNEIILRVRKKPK